MEKHLLNHVYLTDEGRHSAHEYQRIRMSGLLSGKRDSDDADGEGLSFYLKITNTCSL